MFPSSGDAVSVLALDATVLLVLYVLCRLLDPRKTFDRILFGGLTGVLLLTYAGWRWHETLPSFELTMGALWSYLFFTFEAVAILYTFMSIIILFRAKDRSEQASVAEARLMQSGAWPPVDIFICTYNEPLEVLEKSIIAALAIDYPQKTVWVLDDTRRPWLREYCDDVGASYLTRPDNKGAKGGNLNNGLRVTASFTNAPLILVLDADFAPQPNILRRMVGLFDDPKAALVQSPQFFFNADPIQHNLGIAQSWVDDQRIFFDIFQPAKDAWGSAFCVGTSFIVRRDRLTEIGGFPDDAICEDLNLSCALMREGYETHWLNERLSAGLSAEGLPEYITQRTRWCLGTIQVALLKSGPFRGPGYSLVQRMHFLHGILNWLCKPFIVLMLIAPAIYWFADLPAFEADYLDFLHYGLPMLLATWAYNGWVSRSRTLPVFMEITHAMTALAITATLVLAAIKPFGRPFKVTEKGGDRSVMRVRWRLAALFGGMSLLSVASIAWAFLSPEASTEVSPMDYFNLVWAGVSLALTFIAFLVCFEFPREEEMFEVRQPTSVVTGDTIRPAIVEMASLSRVVLRFGGEAPVIGEKIVLELPGAGWTDAHVTRSTVGWTSAELQTAPHQHRALVAWLFTAPRDTIARHASMAGALAGLFRRGLGLS